MPIMMTPAEIGLPTLAAESTAWARPRSVGRYRDNTGIRIIADIAATMVPIAASMNEDVRSRSGPQVGARKAAISLIITEGSPVYRQCS